MGFSRRHFNLPTMLIQRRLFGEEQCECTLATRVKTQQHQDDTCPHDLLWAELLALMKGRAEIQARCGRPTGGGLGPSDPTLSLLFGGEGITFSLGAKSGECWFLALVEINMCRWENFFLALSKVLIILFSESTLVSAEGGVVDGSGLERLKSLVDWLPRSGNPFSGVCFSTEGNSPGALEGLEDR